MKNTSKTPERTLLDRVGRFLSTRAAETALSKGLAFLRERGPRYLKAATMLLSGKARIEARAPSPEQQRLTTVAEQPPPLNAAASAAMQLELAGIRAEIAAERAKSRENEVRTTLAALMRDGHGRPDLLETDLGFALTLNAEQQDQYIEIRRQHVRAQQMMGMFHPTLQENPEEVLSNDEEELQALRLAAGVDKKASS